MIQSKYLYIVLISLFIVTSFQTIVSANPEKKFIKAIKYGNLMKTIQIVERNKLPINRQYGISKKYPLQIAIENGKYQIIWYLIRKKAKFNIIKNIWYILLKSNLKHSGNETQTLALANYIYKTNPIYYRKIINNEHTLFGFKDYAILYLPPKDIRLLSFFITIGADLTVKDSLQNTLLHKFAAYGTPKSIAILLRHGAKLNVKNSTGHTPFHKAALNDNFENVKYLLKSGSDPNITDNNGNTPFININSSTPNGGRIKSYILNSQKDTQSSIIISKRKREANEKRYGKMLHYIGIFSLPVFYTGLAIYNKEHVYRQNPYDNPMITFNAYFWCGALGATAGGFLIGTIFAGDSNGWEAYGLFLLGGTIGAIIGASIGINIAYKHERVFNKPALYYAGPAITVLVPILIISF